MWAKIVNNEVMQLHDEDPTGLWHPDAIAKNELEGYWDNVPDEVHIGWKFRNDEWISGGQFYDEWVENNPPPEPGPPSAMWAHSTLESNDVSATVHFQASPAGIWDSYYWVIDGKEYGQEENLEILFNFEKKSRDIPIKFTVVGPGGTVSNSTGVTTIPLRAKITPP